MEMSGLGLWKHEKPPRICPLPPPLPPPAACNEAALVPPLNFAMVDDGIFRPQASAPCPAAPAGGGVQRGGARAAAQLRHGRRRHLPLWLPRYLQSLNLRSIVILAAFECIQVICLMTGV
ncbi:uncharacterized protein [Miscanthus floridulus]|uniref:uncharacterized protein isoform X2 n=1 Tax=Miscanthus floridulus TaxID=154761 RepID=UPI0034577F30